MDGGAPRRVVGRAAGAAAAAQTFRLAVGERIGSGALGEVRHGTIGDVGVALKALHMLRTSCRLVRRQT